MRKGTLGPRQGVVAAHAIGCRQVPAVQRRADHVDSFERPLAVDAVRLALALEAGIAYLADEVLADLVVVDHRADPQADLSPVREAAGVDTGAAWR